MYPTPASAPRSQKPGPRGLAALALGLITASAGDASTVTLVSRTTCSTAPHQAVCRVEIENEGDESAVDLGLAVTVTGRGEIGRALGTLAPGESAIEKIALPWAQGAGRLPLILRLRYSDEQGYPLSAISHAWIESASGGSLPVEGLVEPATLAGPGRVRWRLTNRGSTRLTLTATLLAPDELELDAPLRRIELAPGQTAHGFHPVAAGTALPGSRYRVYLLLEKEDATARRSHLMPSTVTVASARHAAVLYRRPALVGLVAVAAVACCLQALLAARLARRRSLWSLG